MRTSVVSYFVRAFYKQCSYINSLHLLVTQPFSFHNYYIYIYYRLTITTCKIQDYKSAIIIIGSNSSIIASSAKDIFLSICVIIKITVKVRIYFINHQKIIKMSYILLEALLFILYAYIFCRIKLFRFIMFNCYTSFSKMITDKLTHYLKISICSLHCTIHIKTYSSLSCESSVFQ